MRAALQNLAGSQDFYSLSVSLWNDLAQGRLTMNNRYTLREFKLKFSALLKDYDLKYSENSKK